MKNETDSSKQVDEALRCPITGEIMTDPVVDPDGNTYEKAAILDWLSKNGSSPLTRKPLRPEQLSPNRALRDLLETEHGTEATDRQVSVAQVPEPPEAPLFDVSLKAMHNNDEGLALVQVRASDDASRDHSPCAVVCVIDVSYSMDSPATMHNDSEGSAGLSLLDVVKHAARTMIETLGSHDRLAIVAYADSGNVVLPFTSMSADNRAEAWKKVDSLQTCGSTNLWDGLLKAMDLVEIENAPKSNILLLTDGLPNIHPPRGTLPTLRRYKESHPELQRCRISTFGFGYSLDSALLNEIAVEGGGHYGFIPDSSFVGTTFVNATAGILSTALTECTLCLESTNGGSIQECLSGQQTVACSWGISIALPVLLYGQTQDILVKVQAASDGSSPLKATLKIDHDVPGFKGSKDDLEGVQAVLCAPPSEGFAELRAAEARSTLAHLVEVAESRFPKNNYPSQDEEALKAAQRNHQACAEKIMLYSKQAPEHSGLAALAEDIKGQIAEAYERVDWHRRWGRHYLLSLARAHVLQQCTNFKDPGLQVYATDKFSLIRDEADDIFCRLPPPKPSLARDDRPAVPIASMALWHNSSDPCFASGQVKLSDGSTISVDKVRAGDRIMTVGGKSTSVRCVVATPCENGTAVLVPLPGGVLVTPWHPLREVGSSKWQFPGDIATPALYECDAVYSFVLDEDASAMRIGPYEAVSLGHGLVDDPVARHEYLGTARVLDDLSKMVGWKEGRVNLSPSPAVRDPHTGLIVGLTQHDPDSTPSDRIDHRLGPFAHRTIAA